MSEGADKTIELREESHGPWSEGCNISQKIKKLMSKNANSRPDFINEAIDRICMKLSRIAVGDFLEPDHWHDIQGYANLTEKELLKYENKNV